VGRICPPLQRQPRSSRLQCDERTGHQCAFGRFTSQYNPDWDAINRVYRRVVEAIRAIDSEHIIFLEGDYFSSRFEGFEAPFTDNLVYSSHNYTAAGFGPGSYPGSFNGVYWDMAKQEEVFLQHEGTRFAQKHNVPLWVGEFGSVYNGPQNENEDRLQALDDQLTVFGRNQAHWTTWTYKDVGVMGWVTLPPKARTCRRSPRCCKPSTICIPTSGCAGFR
jgi:endoglucanase